MDQNEGNHQWDMPWYDWLVFLVPISLIVGLGLESALGPEGVEYRDFRAVAHWFDPVFFQYNLIMTLLAVLVVPSLALSYIQTMANRKERRLQREVPLERRGEVRRRMGRRASFSNYRGSVWLTTTVVLLGTCILLLFKPVSSAGETGVDFSLGANMMTMGPFVELFENNPDAYYSHLTRSLTAFQFGFLGAYIYFIGSVVRAYFTFDLTSHTFVDGTIRMIVASILALVLSFAFDFIFAGDLISDETSASAHVGDSTESASAAKLSSAENSSAIEDSASSSEEAESTIPASLSLLPVLSFFFGFYPKRALLAIERIVLKVMRNTFGESYRALPLSMLSGMSYAHELRLEREGYDNIENLSNADAVDIAVRTCFSYSQSKQWIDQAWLAAHLREDYPEFVRRTGITNSDELQRFLFTCDRAQVDGVGQLVAGLSTDSAAGSSWKVKLAALKILLDVNTAGSEPRQSREKGE
ncbi:hypothetical protein SAMN05216420_11018 [Nitrosospira sp. Nl5]|uniref:hypothetical protein n=1 Tax=Nitrosospira sp. Nl5 TaxID=200120 RepID=UPI00088F396E|nr:hypothetical protein [Nitrosospira sp. Nl5]SCY60853.1 hypothetical protein SAMN05216420_11018 [Nitrosospira sp. Nl5]